MLCSVPPADSLLQVNKHTAEFSQPGVIQEQTGSTSLCLLMSILTHRSGLRPALQSKCLLCFLKNQHRICHKHRKITRFKSLKNEASWFILIYNETSHARVVFQDSVTIDAMEVKREILHEADNK